jgi:hypothetical protein
LIASSVIGGLMLMSFTRFSNDLSRDAFLDTLDNAAYHNLAEIVEIIEADLSRIGLGINDPTQAVFIQAGATDLRFYLDGNGDGVIDSIRYYLGDVTSAASTENPNDKILYRVVNNGPPEAISAGLTDFDIEYYDGAGNVAGSLSQIRTFEVSLELESGQLYDQQGPKMVWQGKFTPPNLVTH